MRAEAGLPWAAIRPRGPAWAKVVQQVVEVGGEDMRKGARWHLGQGGAFLGQAGEGHLQLTWNPHYQCWGYELPMG